MVRGMKERMKNGELALISFRLFCQRPYASPDPTLYTMTDASSPRSYKETVRLPKTNFAMKANLVQSEPASMKRWESMGLHDQLLAARSEAEPFVFHDGPPYANGNIHAGHLLNKVLKDFVVRSALMEGHRVHYVPGWDTHGLPIEHKVMTELHEKGKGAKIDGLEPDARRMAIRRECAASAKKFIELQTTQMKRLLTMADYAHPYFTMMPEFESKVLDVFALLLEQGVVYRALKPVHWSIANKTALAEAELEYEDREDLSVYVDFEAVDKTKLETVFGCEIDVTPSFMIWTTTPWTLPANLAIAVHPRNRYALVEMDGSTSILASELVDRVAKKAGVETVVRLAEVDGEQLLGLEYKHPFCDRLGRIVAADYVTLEDGTGLVHTAPGHGADDYRTGLKEGLPAYCPVKEDGTYDDSVPAWLIGKSIWDANPEVAEHLRESGHLFHDHKFTHSYPHDWRSKTPVIFRSTEQWFISVDRPTKRDNKSLRAMAISAVEHDVEFVPEWGRNRMRGMLESRPDWCLSRQRAWGLPIPAFKLADGTVFLTSASVRAIAARVAEKGSDCWFMETPAELLAGYDAKNDPDAPAGFDLSTITKLYDIFDVWFEAGSSWNAVLRARGLGYPSEAYLEGSDQHRGWFQLSLLPALGATGVAPFKRLVTHGFIVDKEGKKMSKSLGNTIEVETVMKDHGADVARWWTSSIDYENDIRMDIEFFNVAGEAYRKVRNTIRYLLSNLEDFDHATHGIAPSAHRSDSLEAWMLAELSRVQREVRASYKAFRFRDGNRAIFDFCNDTLSAGYCVATKDRLYCDAADSPRRRAAQSAMYTAAATLCRMLAPLLPHTADEAWRVLKRDDAACIMLEQYEALDVTADSRWEAVWVLEDAVGKALEAAKSNGIDNKLDAGLVLPDPTNQLQPFMGDLADLFGVSRVALAADGAVQVEDLREQPRCERSWRRDVSVRLRSDGGMLSDRDAQAIGV